MKITLQGEVILSKATLQRRIIHQRKITRERVDPHLEKIAPQGEVTLRRIAALQRRVCQLTGLAPQQEDPLQVKNILQGVFTPLIANVLMNIIHPRRVTL